jgi:hypothetical protein
MYLVQQETNLIPTIMNNSHLYKKMQQFKMKEIIEENCFRYRKATINCHHKTKTKKIIINPI